MALAKDSALGLFAAVLCGALTAAFLPAPSEPRPVPRCRLMPLSSLRPNLLHGSVRQRLDLPGTVLSRSAGYTISAWSDHPAPRHLRRSWPSSRPAVPFSFGGLDSGHTARCCWAGAGIGGTRPGSQLTCVSVNTILSEPLRTHRKSRPRPERHGYTLWTLSPPGFVTPLLLQNERNARVFPPVKPG